MNWQFFTSFYLNLLLTLLFYQLITIYHRLTTIGVKFFYQIYYVYKLSCYSSLIMIPTLFVRQNSLPLSNFFLRILLPSDLYEEQRMNDRYYDPTNQKLKFIISKKKKKIEIHETMRVRYSIGLRSNQLEAHATTYPKMNSCPWLIGCLYQLTTVGERNHKREKKVLECSKVGQRENTVLGSTAQIEPKLQDPF